MDPVAIAQASPTGCQLAVQARCLGAATSAIAISAFEGWLRVPIQAVLDAYVRAVLDQAASLLANLRNLSS